MSFCGACHVGSVFEARQRRGRAISFSIAHFLPCDTLKQCASRLLTRPAHPTCDVAAALEYIEQLVVKADPDLEIADLDDESQRW